MFSINSSESRSEGRVKAWTRSPWLSVLTDLTMLFDSWANMNIHNNPDILANLLDDATKSKSIWESSAHFLFYTTGNMSLELKHLPLVHNTDYYCSPQKMVKILLLGVISKSFKVFMDLRIENAFYIFDEKGKYQSKNLQMPWHQIVPTS